VKVDRARRVFASRASVQPRQLPPWLALPGEIAKWSLTTLREKVVEIGQRLSPHGRAEATDKTAHLAGAALRQPD